MGNRPHGRRSAPAELCQQRVVLFRSVDLDESLERDGSEIRIGISDESTQRPARPCKSALPERQSGRHPTLRERMAERPEKTIVERRADRSCDLVAALLAGPRALSTRPVAMPAVVGEQIQPPANRTATLAGPARGELREERGG